MTAAVLAGTLSTLMFAGSMMPMLARAWRTQDLASYSRGHLVLTNLGNAVHSVYVASLPLGPVWMLHAFHVAVSAVMLGWHVRYAGSRPALRQVRRGTPASASALRADPREDHAHEPEHRQGTRHLAEHQ
jgi:hypothetical protein